MRAKIDENALEAGLARALADNSHDGTAQRAVVAVSLAISAKRIADTLEYFLELAKAKRQ